MSNARDKANIPVLNFQSKGIDDNADATAITINSSENVGIGTTAPINKLHVFNTDHTQLCLEGARPTMFLKETNGNANENFQFRVDGGDLQLQSQNDAQSSASTRLLITQSGNVGIGTSSPSTTLDVNGGLNCGFLQSSSSIYATSGIIRSSDGSAASPSIQPGVDSNTGFFRPATDTIGFSNGGSERMRLDATGDLTLGATLTQVQPGFSNSTQAISLRGGSIEQFFISSAANPIYANRTVDGGLINLRSGGNQEGVISVSGSTVTYGGFTGTHWSRFTDNSKPTILKGTVLETLDEMCDWYNLEFDVTDEEGNTSTQGVPHVLEDGQSIGDTVAHTYQGTDYQATIVKETDIKHMKSKVSDTVDAKNVYGVFHSWDDNDEEEGYNDFIVASVGSFVVRIKANETIAKGDLLQSNGDGTAKVQTDDAVRSSSFAKVLSTTIIETYEDGSYLVPCSLKC